MSAVIPWIERRFDFEFPVGLYPNILARIRGTPPRLEEAVRSLTRAQLTAKPDGRWSIQEHAGHLLDEETLFAKRLDDYAAAAETLTPAPYAKVDLRHHERDVEGILRDFRSAREQHVERLARLKAEDFARAAWHGRLKVNMRLVDHLLFFAEHDDHHLSRIWELRSAL